MIREHRAISSQRLVLLSALAFALWIWAPVSAQEVSIELCRPLDLQFVQKDDCPVRLLKGTRVCKQPLPKDIPEHLKRERDDRMPIRVIVRNESERPVVRLTLVWNLYAADGVSLQRMRTLLDKGERFAKPMLLKPGKRFRWDFHLPVPNRAAEPARGMVQLVEIAFDDGTVWPTSD